MAIHETFAERHPSKSAGVPGVTILRVMLARRRVVRLADRVAVRPAWSWLVVYGGLPLMLLVLVAVLISGEPTSRDSEVLRVVGLLPGLLVLLGLLRLARCRLELDPAHVRVVNPLRSHTTGWDAIDRIETVDLRYYANPLTSLGNLFEPVGGIGVRYKSGRLVRCTGVGALHGRQAFEVLSAVRHASAAHGVRLETPAST